MNYWKWKSGWVENGEHKYVTFRTRQAALDHNGKLLRNGFTVLGVTKNV